MLLAGLWSSATQIAVGVIAVMVASIYVLASHWLPKPSESRQWLLFARARGQGSRVGQLVETSL